MKTRYSQMLVASVLTLFATANLIGDENQSKESQSSESGIIALKPTEQLENSASLAAKPIEEKIDTMLTLDFPMSMQAAYSRYRAGEEQSAAKHIEEAISFLRKAEIDADKATKANLLSAAVDLSDIADQLKAGKPVYARRLNSAFANAAIALSKHHGFLSRKAHASDNLKAASEQLSLAVDHLRDACHAANHAYSREIEDYYDNYAAPGQSNEVTILKKSMIATNLESVEKELDILAKKLSGRK